MDKIISLKVSKKEVMKIKYNAVFPSTEINILLLCADKWFSTNNMESFIDLLERNNCEYEVKLEGEE